MKKTRFAVVTGLLVAAGAMAGCSSQPVEGPDKVFADGGMGALEGAGAGAVTGLHVGAGTGPGALVGAGLGAALGAVQGFAHDGLEESDIKTARQLQLERERSVAQEALAEHYKRRLQLHPTRDIFPADLFFEGDSVKMCPSGVRIVKEIARMNEHRLPYSRIVIAAYAKAADDESEYAKHLTERRSREFVNQLVRAGVEARRLETRAVTVDAPVLIDPMDNPTRYNQAIEIIPIDR